MKKHFIGLLLVTAILSCKKETTVQVDKIRSALTTSATAYDAVAVNNWVKVTSTEYNTLLTVLSGSARQGTAESTMITSTTIGWQGNYTVALGSIATKVPASSFIVAWSVRTGGAPSSALGSKLKVSDSQNSGFVDYGGTLPDVGSLAANTRVFFVLKTPSTTTPASAAFTAVYNAVESFLGIVGGGSTAYYVLGDNGSPAGAYSSTEFSQVISTPTKQW